MTGTAISDAAELRRIYKVGVMKIPTNRTCGRVWLPDRVFSTEEEKFRAVADQVVEWNKHGVPVLIGTRSIEKSEKLSSLLAESSIEHQVLNAKNHEIEAQIVAQAGPAGPGDRRHQHGRPRHRHQARRRRRRARRPARHRHRTPRVDAGSTASSPAGRPDRETPASASSSSALRTRSSKRSARSPPPASASATPARAS